MALRDNLIVEPILLSVTDAQGRLDFSQIFGNSHPLELEIGSGKGTFLLAISEAQSQSNFIGIEWSRAYAEFAADRLRRHGRNNCRMVHAEASWWLRCHVPDAALSAVHVYFPDPWPKARHHKRRLIQPAFITDVHRVLRPGGRLRMVTDHEGYFAHMQEVLNAQSLLQQVEFDKPVAHGEGLVVGTNFERKYITEGRTFHALAADKPGAV